jgi:hypothetical protein
VSSKVQIANRALQKCGVTQRLGTFEDNSQEGRAIRTCYDILKAAELQANVWTFAVRRVQLSADTETPAFDYTYQFQLPADFLRLAPLRPKIAEAANDYQIEGRKLLTNSPGPIPLRIVSKTADEEWFHAMFVEGLAARVAFEICEELTQSSSKKDGLASEYVKFISMAKTQNAIEKGPVQPSVDSWETVRQGGSRNTIWYDGS